MNSDWKEFTPTKVQRAKSIKVGGVLFKDIYVEKEELTAQLKERDEEIERLKEISDMKSAIIDGMRRVCAIARMINTQKPDVRMDHALKSYDICKVNHEHSKSLKERDELLQEGAKYMREGHLKFTPHVTSSLMLDWIGKANKILGE